MNLLLGKELQNIQSGKATPVEISFIEKVPLLIQKLYSMEINSTTSGIKRLRISKEAAESAFFSISEESMRAQRYCFILAKTLNLDLSKLKMDQLTYIPPIKISLNEKKEYNSIAIILNREIEKIKLQEYADEIGMLLSSQSLLVHNEHAELNKDFTNYQRIIKFDYPVYSEHELNYLIGLLKFQAEVMGIKLTDEQLGLQEEIPIFGTNNEMLETRYEKGKNLSTQDEIQFYNDLILYDLMTQFMKISTILPNLLPIGEYFESIVFSENNSPGVKSILEQKKELEPALAWCSFRPPSIEYWESLLGKILAINDDYLHMALSKEQQIGQKPIMFSLNPEMYNRHIASIEQKIKYLKLVKEINLYVMELRFFRDVYRLAKYPVAFRPPM